MATIPPPPQTPASILRRYRPPAPPDPDRDLPHYCDGYHPRAPFVPALYVLDTIDRLGRRSRSILCAPCAATIRRLLPPELILADALIRGPLPPPLPPPPPRQLHLELETPS